MKVIYLPLNSQYVRLEIGQTIKWIYSYEIFSINNVGIRIRSKESQSEFSYTFNSLKDALEKGRCKILSYQVFYKDKPADKTEYPYLQGNWDNSKFNTYAEALDYAKRFTGNRNLALIPNQPKNGMLIQEISNV